MGLELEKRLIKTICENAVEKFPAILGIAKDYVKSKIKVRLYFVLDFCKIVSRKISLYSFEMLCR